jgi:hypothetical protein
MWLLQENSQKITALAISNILSATMKQGKRDLTAMQTTEAEEEGFLRRVPRKKGLGGGLRAVGTAGARRGARKPARKASIFSFL